MGGGGRRTGGKFEKGIMKKTFNLHICFRINKAWLLNRMIFFLLHTAVCTQPRNISL